TLFGLLLLLVTAAGADPIADSPAADTSEAAFFLKAAEYRTVAPELPRATGATLERAAHFLLRDTGINNNALRDEQGRKVPPYIYHAVIDGNDHFGYRSAFPAFHHAYLIEAFLNYYNYSGEKEALRRARELADWNIAHSTPADWKWPFLPWSTFTEGKPGGYEDKDALQPDKVGYMGLSYTRLYEVTGDGKYLDAAKKAADTLTAQQSGDGSWPFRVNPQTGVVVQQYTAALFMNVAFLEKMFALTRNLDYKNAQITAWMWMLRNPIRTNNWAGLYEDIPKDSDSQVHYSPAQTIRLLLRYRTPINADSYLEHARKLFDYTMDGLAFDDRDMGLLLREQTGYLAATPSSTLNWSMMSAEFFLTTGEEKYRATTLEALRMVTRYGLKPDGRTHNTVLGERMYGDWGSWYSLTSPIVRYLYQDMGCLPECAPNGETHLLRTATQIRRITYAKQSVSYETPANSIELLKLAAAPQQVKAGGRSLSASAQLVLPNSYSYNPRSHVLLVRHTDPPVEVIFAASQASALRSAGR
ncbi:MAG TPA: glycoside hydrolase family 47 protein, partial [Chthonomonadaceae bacterium]|nr:glycoside hydrolase family 47 protein [Chthonomonadaceae bacterium]